MSTLALLAFVLPRVLASSPECPDVANRTHGSEGLWLGFGASSHDLSCAEHLSAADFATADPRSRP